MFGLLLADDVNQDGNDVTPDGSTLGYATADADAANGSDAVDGDGDGYGANGARDGNDGHAARTSCDAHAISRRTSPEWQHGQHLLFGRCPRLPLPNARRCH